LFQECHDLFGRGGLDGRDGLEAIRLLYRGPGRSCPADLVDGVVDQVAYLRRFQDRFEDRGLAVPRP
jgi:hypothetical protein